MNPNGAWLWHSYGFAVTMVAEPGVIVAVRSRTETLAAGSSSPASTR
jgi:hypothetical protein